MSIAVPRRNPDSFARSPAWIESLEGRQLLSLLGVTLGDTYVETANTGSGSASYDADSKQFTVQSLPYALNTPDDTGVFMGTYSLDIGIRIDSSGKLLGGVDGDDLALTGQLYFFGSGEMFDGVLLQGEIAPYALGADVDAPRFDALFNVTGGQLAGLFSGKQIGLTLDLSQGSSGSLAGAFGASFLSTLPVAKVGPVDPRVIPPPPADLPPQEPETPPPQDQGTPLHQGQTAGIGFWRNKQGQKLLASAEKGLGKWMATNWPNLFRGLAHKSNAGVAELYRNRFAKLPVFKLQAQTMATAFAVYVTGEGRGGPLATKLGFEVSGEGTGAAMVSVGRSGKVFGVANGTNVRVNDALAAADEAFARPKHRFSLPMRLMLHDVFSRIIEAGSID